MSLAGIAIALTRFSSRYVPGAFSIACLLTFVTVVLGMTVGGATPVEVIKAWGDGFWALLTFGMQMCLVVFCGYLVAISPVVRRALRWIAALPPNPTAAVMAMAAVAMIVAWINWGLGLATSAVMVGFVARRHPDADYRLLVAVAYFGLGATWHAGPSGSVPLLLATPENFLIKGGILAETISMARTVWTPFNLIFAGGMLCVLTGLAGLLHPKRGQRVGVSAQVAEQVAALDQQGSDSARGESSTVAERIERLPLVNLLLGAMMLVWLILHFADKGFVAGLNLNVVNFIFFFLAIWLHGRPKALGEAAAHAVRHVHGIVLQFPLYAGMFGIISSTSLARKIADAFVALASARSLPLVTFWYSGVLNYFVPSGGSKWAIEAPYLIAAGRRLGVSPERVAMAYAYGDMSTNLIQPFWAIPLLSVAELEFSEILGFEMIAFLLYAGITSLVLYFVY